MNISDHPIRLYKPGLVGPNIGGPKGQVLCAEFPQQLHPGGYGLGDFVILEPGEIWGGWSAYPSSYRGADCELSAYYMFRAPWAKDGDVPVYTSDADSADSMKK
jgi:hypothetical protein